MDRHAPAERSRPQHRPDRTPMLFAADAEI
jgi:hypothetical protein